MRTNSRYFRNIASEFLNAPNVVVMWRGAAPGCSLSRTQPLKPLRKSETHFPLLTFHYTKYAAFSFNGTPSDSRIVHALRLQVGPLPSLRNGKANRTQHSHLLRSSYTGNEWINTVMFGNKMPTRCNRGFYCRSYCLVNMFRAPLCPSSGAQEYYTMVAACGISCCGFQVVSLVWS